MHAYPSMWQAIPQRSTTLQRRPAATPLNSSVRAVIRRQERESLTRQGITAKGQSPHLIPPPTSPPLPHFEPEMQGYLMAFLWQALPLRFFGGSITLTRSDTNPLGCFVATWGLARLTPGEALNMSGAPLVDQQADEEREGGRK